MKRYIIVLLLLLSATVSKAQVEGGVINWVIEKVTAIDSAYIEPSHYDFSVIPTYMLNQERFRVSTSDGMEMNFRSKTANKLGAFAGWRFLVLGLTWDLNYHVDKDIDDERQKTEFNMSIFSQPFNIDLFYRQTGGDFQMTKLSIPSINNVMFDEHHTLSQELLEEMNNTSQFGDFLDFSGSMIRSKMIGFNGYYVFNHKKFSYPAAWTNSSRQKLSAGSPIVGFGYTHHKIDDDLWLLPYSIASFAKDINKEHANDPSIEVIPGLETDAGITSFMQHSNLCTSFKYNDWSFWGGYAYNWVPCKNLLVGASATLGLGIKHSSGNNEGFIANIIEMNDFFKGSVPTPNPYSFSHTTVDWNGVGRLSVVWNNDRIFGGGRGNINFYRYRNGNSLMKFDNIFWGLEFYFGIKFVDSLYWKKAKHKIKI